MGRVIPRSERLAARRFALSRRPSRYNRRVSPTPAPPAASALTPLAAIDVGSNSIHMIVVAPEARGAGYRVLDRERDMVRLGRSALTDGRLSDKAIDDGLGALLKMTTIARLKGAERIVAVATSAVREAENGADFLARVRAQTGLDVRVLSGEEEALLIHRAVREVVDLDQGRTLVIDIGGGSTEWIASEDGAVTTAVSLPLGSLRLAAELTGAPPTAASLRKLRKRIVAAIERLPTTPPAELVVATSGTAVCVADLADLAAGRDRSNAPRGLREIRVKELQAVIERLERLRRREIAALPPVGEPRSDSILPGAVLLGELLARAGVDRFQVSDRALRDGLVLESLGHAAPAAAGQESRRRRQVQRLAERAPAVVRHGEQTARLAVRLFDLLPSIHGLGEREREWLEHAAQLHDLGYLVRYAEHHKHSYYLIVNAELDAFDPREIAIIAHVARFHRGSDPRAGKHPTFAALDRWQRDTVVRLAALLRIADALDRTHASRVSELYATVRKKRVTIEVLSPFDVEVELKTARERAPLFERAFGRELEIRQGLESPDRDAEA